jgi:NAD(P)-dependent dehydrogenase (short-subunit alcohol dehydrogenase family)
MNQKSKSNKVVFITGSSAGIGEATAYRFAKEGYVLVITYRNDKVAAEQVAEKSREHGAADVLIVKLDVSSTESIEQAVASIIEKYDRIDILINNAGVLGYGSLGEQTDDEINRQIQTNLTGVIKTTKACLPYIKTSIINIASALGLVGRRNLTVYCATKFGVRGFSQALAHEQPGLVVYSVNPGLTATRMASFKGMPVKTVAEVIYKAALGQYKVPRGGDINMHDYIHGSKLGYWLSLARGLKRVLKTTIYK